jgi:hypothetical protein
VGGVLEAWFNHYALKLETGALPNARVLQKKNAFAISGWHS